MKLKNIFKVLLNMSMTIVFVLLFNKTVLGGLRFHEIAGLP